MRIRSLLHIKDFLRNGHEINWATGAIFLFVFKAHKQAHSKLRNCLCNTEDGQKDKLVAQVCRARSLLLTKCKPVPIMCTGQPGLKTL